MSMTTEGAPLFGLPDAWLWTGRRSLGASGTIFYARDSRWEPAVPDVAGMTRAEIVRYAEECNLFGPKQ